jgi:hypothetical protein
MGIYSRPSKKLHRGFAYLNDETVINSLSSLEAGKIDEIVAKINSAREGGFGGGAGMSAVHLEGGKKSSSSLEEEIVRTRTRFSVFHTWYDKLTTEKGIGRFDGWGEKALVDVEPGDTIELRATLAITPLQTLFRLFLWFADQARKPGGVWSQNGADLKETKASEQIIKSLVGDEVNAEVVTTAVPIGDEEWSIPVDG